MRQGLPSGALTHTRGEPTMKSSEPIPSDLALVLGGGGARGAYQAGVVRWLAHRRPDLRFPILARLRRNEHERNLRHVETLVLRPSLDLGRLSAEFEPRLPRAFRFATRGLGTRDTESPDALSLLMFQSDYTRRLMDLGEADAHSQGDVIDAFLERDRPH